MSQHNNTLPLKQNKMATEPVGKLMFTMSVPIIVSMAIEALYNVVDSLFVARIGENALTAVSLAFPVHLLIIAVVIGTNVGVGSSLSRRLGAKDQHGVDTSAGNAIFLAVLTCIVFLCFGLFFTKAYFRWQTSNAEIYRLGTEYLSICLVFSFGSIGQITFQRLLQATGKTTLSMVSQLIGAVFNIIFDPILIFGLFGFPAMGVKGAAIATVTGQSLALVIALCFNLLKNKEINFGLKNCRPNGHIIRDIYRVGAPAIINQSFSSLMALGVNYIIISISSTAVAAFGIYIKIQNFIFLPAFGLNNGVIAITAFNYGAKDKKRVDSAIRFGVIYAVCIMLTGTVLIQIFANGIISLFDVSGELALIGIGALRIISLTYVLTGFTLIAQGICQALRNGLYSLGITLARVVVVLFPVLYLFSKLFPLNQIWWAFTIAEVSSAVAGIFLLRHMYAKKIMPLDSAA
jgi:putative MATE family efflux protein